MLVSWYVGILATAVVGMLTLLARQRSIAAPVGAGGPWGRRADVPGILREVTLLLALYSLWRLGQRLHGISLEHGVERALRLWDLQRTLHLPDERHLVNAVVDRPLLAQAANAYYAVLHAPAMGLALAWTVWRRRIAYPRLRNALALTTGACLALHLFAVAPPRLVPGLGFVDVAERYHQSVYGPVGSGVSDQMGAMPSVHVAWAGIVAWVTWHLARGWWRALGPVHLGVTVLAIVATANHWWLDGVVAALILAVLVVADRRLPAAVRALRQRPRPSPEPLLVPAVARTLQP